jgi:cell division GTPase FtsZ
MIDLWDYVLYSSVRKAKNKIKKIQKECDNDLIVIDNDIYHFIEKEDSQQ